MTTRGCHHRTEVAATDALDPSAVPSQDAAMNHIEVIVTSPEAAQDGVAEFSADGRTFAFTILDGEEVVLHLLPHDGEPIVVGARSMMLALQRARELLT